MSDELLEKVVYPRTAKSKPDYSARPAMTAPESDGDGIAKQAMRTQGIEPDIQPIRGGTDGAQLSFRGLPCPNLFTGGANFHGRFEYLPLPSLQAAADTTLQIMVDAGQLKK